MTKARPFPIPVYVTALVEGGYSASWWPVVLVPGNRPASLLRTLMVAEIVEISWRPKIRDGAIRRAWAMRKAAGRHFRCFWLCNSNLAMVWASIGSATARLQRGSTLPCPRATPRQPSLTGPRITDHARITSIRPCRLRATAPGRGCSLAFIYYLFHQFGFSSIPQIIAAAPGVDSSGQSDWYLMPERGLSEPDGRQHRPFSILQASVRQRVSSQHGVSHSGPEPGQSVPACARIVLGRQEHVRQGRSAGHSQHARGEIYQCVLARDRRVHHQPVQFAWRHRPGVHGSVCEHPGRFDHTQCHADRLRKPCAARPLQRIRIAFDITFTSASLAAFPDAGAMRRCSSWMGGYPWADNAARCHLRNDLRADCGS